MPLRMVEIRLDERAAARLGAWPGDRPVIDGWSLIAGDHRHLHALVEARDVEELVDGVIDVVGQGHCRVLSLPVEATVPREKDDPDEAKGEDDGDGPAGVAELERHPIARVSREELYEDLKDSSALTPLFLIQVVLSTIVACVGLLRDDTAVVVGAMVIAPLLGPNVALGFGATLGDLKSIRRSLVTNLAGVGLAFTLAFAAGVLFHVNPALDSIATRVQPGFGDVVLALAAGVAGTLAVTSGMGTALIGVMVAVALLPPLAVAGMLSGAGFGWHATGAATLVTINVICVNLASVATFMLLGIRPRAWWEQQGAERSSRLALVVWTGALLLALIGLLLRTVL